MTTKQANIISDGAARQRLNFLAMGQEWRIGREEVLGRFSELKGQNVVRQISAILDTRRLGYKTTLVAFAYESGQLHQEAQVIGLL